MTLINTFPPHKDESGFGYYRRLSAENSLLNWRELAEFANLPRHRAGFFGASDYVASVMQLESEWVQLANVQEQLAREWRGLYRSHSEAVCPDCLCESAHIRMSWEHVYVTACSQHQKRLLDQCRNCGQLLSKNRERIEQCNCGADLRDTSCDVAPGHELWLSTLISSNGANSCGINPQIKDVPTLNVSNIVRVLTTNSHSFHGHTRGRTPPPRTVAEAIAFLEPMGSLISEWPTSFEEHVRKRIEFGEPSARTLNKLLGRWYVDLRKACDAPSLQCFIESVLKVARESFDGTLGLDSTKKLAEKVSGYMHLKDAARTLGVSRDKLLQVATDKGCQYRTRRLGTRGLTYEIPSEEVDRIRNARSNWISVSLACEFSKVSQVVLKALCDSDVIHSDINWRNDILKGGPVSHPSLMELTERLNSNVKTRSLPQTEVLLMSELTSRRLGDKQAIQGVMQAAATGEICPVRKGTHLGHIGFAMDDVKSYFGTPLLEAGMSINQLSKFTGWKWESIAHWIDSGVLGSQEITLRGQRCRVVLPQHFYLFLRSYVPLSEVAKAVDSQASYVLEKLAGATVVPGKRLPNGTQRGALVSLHDLIKKALTANGKPPPF